MNSLSLIEQISLVDAEAAYEFWLSVGVLAAAATVILCVCWMIGFAKDRISTIMRNAKEHPVVTSIISPMFWSFVTYAAVKAVVPTVEQCDYNMTGAAEPESGVVRYHYFESATNDVDVAMNAGFTTNSVSSVAEGQFYYEFSPTTYGGTDADVASYGFWVRDAMSNEWTRATTDSTWEFPPSVMNYHGRMAHLPGMEDAKDYRFWFIGTEENLPDVVIEGGVGIVIDRVAITASHVHIEFHPEDPDLARGVFQYVLQTRVTRQDVLMDWENVTSTTATGAGGAFDFDGYTVGEYREYRVYADKEVAE